MQTQYFIVLVILIAMHSRNTMNYESYFFAVDLLDLGSSLLADELTASAEYWFDVQ